MFRNAKAGDRVWDYIYGWGTIDGVDDIKETSRPITVIYDNEFGADYTFDGKFNVKDLNPRLFWDEIKFSIPEKPFDLKDELRKLEITDFVFNEENFYLEWDNDTNKIIYEERYWNQQPLGIYFEKESIKSFMNNIKDKTITKEQFFTAYKNVFGGRNAD